MRWSIVVALTVVLAFLAVLPIILIKIVGLTGTSTGWWTLAAGIFLVYEVLDHNS